MNHTTKTAWAIALDDGHFIGAYRFLHTVPEPLDGNHTCLWASRKLAREALKRVKGPAREGKYSSARVARVTVRIGEAR